MCTTVLGNYAQENYAQTEITPKEIKLLKANGSDYFQVIINISALAGMLL